MRLNVYIDNEYVYGIRNISEENLTDIQKLLLKNPIIINLGDIGYVPKIGSDWNGSVFSEIDIEDYQSFIAGTEKEYFAIILEGKVVEILNYNQEREIAIMSSNPVIKLEDDISGPVNNPLFKISE